jgi:hypothetical protein
VSHLPTSCLSSQVLVQMHLSRDAYRKQLPNVYTSRTMSCSRLCLNPMTAW